MASAIAGPECPDCGAFDAEVTEKGSAGRLWAYRGLHRALAIRQVTPDVAIAAARIALRRYRAKGLTRTITVDRVDQTTGRVHRRRTTDPPGAPRGGADPPEAVAGSKQAGTTLDETVVIAPH